jgi:hypothetical protein
LGQAKVCWEPVNPGQQMRTPWVVHDTQWPIWISEEHCDYRM